METLLRGEIIDHHGGDRLGDQQLRAGAHGRLADRAFRPPDASRGQRSPRKELRIIHELDVEDRATASTAAIITADTLLSSAAELSHGRLLACRTASSSSTRRLLLTSRNVPTICVLPSIRTVERLPRPGTRWPSLCTKSVSYLVGSPPPLSRRWTRSPTN